VSALFSLNDHTISNLMFFSFCSGTCNVPLRYGFGRILFGHMQCDPAGWFGRILFGHMQCAPTVRVRVDFVRAHAMCPCGAGLGGFYSGICNVTLRVGLGEFYSGTCNVPLRVGLGRLLFGHMQCDPTVRVRAAFVWAHAM